MKNNDKSTSSSRRDFLKKTAYVAPVLLSIPARPALAGHGSVKGQGIIHGNTK